MDNETSECSYCKREKDEISILVCKEIRQLLKELEHTPDTNKINKIKSRISWLKIALPKINKHFTTEI